MLFYKKQSNICNGLSYSCVELDEVFVKPPIVIPTACEPPPAPNLNAVIKAPPDDQDVPLYSSVQDTEPTPALPPTESPAFCVPAPDPR